MEALARNVLIDINMIFFIQMNKFHKLYSIFYLKRYCTHEKASNFTFLTETPSKNRTFKKTASQNHI